MAQPTTTMTAPMAAATITESRPAYQAYQLLHWGFVLFLLVAGLDKFQHLLVNWDKYVAPTVQHSTSLSVHAVVSIAGAIEVVAALLIAVKPRIGAYIAALWFACGVANLVLLQNYYDVALRDVGLFLAAIALGLLSKAHEKAKKADQNVITP